uniref:Uncharacterized LOC111941114 n=1 Tax=Cyanistes caeruleus TaxID=156563 RepID=A0A8C0U313_CYACU
MHPDMCQHIRARCRLEHHSSSNCEAKEVKREEILQGQEGTFTCSALQPFTVYSVTISLLPRTILYTWLLTTKETVPDKPENLLMDVSTGSLRWKALPSCKGEIIGYQVPGVHVGCPWSPLTLPGALCRQPEERCEPSLARAHRLYTAGAPGGARSPSCAQPAVAASLCRAAQCRSRMLVLLSSSSLSFLQLNITTMRAEDGSFLGFSQELVNQSVSEYVPPNQRAGRKYLVTVQGLTAAGAGAAAELEFKTYIQGPWPVSAVSVVVVVVLLIPLSAGILWFVLSRRKKALPSKAEEDHYTELQPYENVHEGNYCVMETFLEKDAGKCGQAGEPSPKPLPVLESSGESKQ